MEITKKRQLKRLGSLLVLAVLFLGIFGWRNASSIKANEGSGYSLEIVDGNYLDSSVVRMKLSIDALKKETLKLTAEGTSYIDPESLVEDLDSKQREAIEVKTTSDDNTLELQLTGKGEAFSTIVEVRVDRNQNFSEGRVFLKNAADKLLCSTAFEQIHDPADFIQTKELSSRMLSVDPMSLTLPTPVNPVDVSTWAELSAALTSTSVDWINLKANITAGADVSVTTSKVINGDNNGTKHSYDFAARNLTLGAGAAGSKIILTNLDITGNSATAMFASSTANSSKWEVQLDNVSNLSTNARPLVNLRDGKLLITGTGSLSTTRNSNYANIKTLAITDQAVLDINLANTFYETTVDDSNFSITGNSKVKIYSATDNVIRSSGQVTFTFEGQETDVDISGNFTTSGSGGGLVSINNDDSKINVLDGAEVNVRSLSATNATPAIMMMSARGVFTVDGASKLYLESGSNTNDLSSVLRFRSKGHMTFDVKGNSTIEINRTGGNAAALRMYGDNNIVNVSGGSDVIVTNVGNGTPTNPGGDGRNQAIHYDSGSNTVPSQFNLTEEDSSVMIDADNGAAIDGDGYATSIVAGEGTYFVARGRTANAASGANNAIFSATGAKISVTMDRPKYFDFRNDRPGGGNVFRGGATSLFTLTNSMLAVWENGRDLDGNPSKSWTVMDSVWSGTDFATGTSSNNTDFNTSFLGAPAYSRMTANNQAAIIDELRVPTDADKYIWGHASVPEGKHEDSRDAYTDEVHVRAAVYNADGTFAYNVVGSSIGDDGADDGIAVYGDDPRAGIFKINTDQDVFLTAGQTIKVVAAWRGSLLDEGTSLVYESKPSDLQAPERTVLDVTPPEPTALTDANLNNATKVLSGENAAINAKVYIYYDNGDKDAGTLLGTTTVQSDGKWHFNLPHYIEKTKELSVYLEDDAPEHTAAAVVSAPGETPVLYDQIGLIKPPATNSATGNINPYNDYTYHDTVFKGVKKYSTADVLPDNPTMTKDVKVYRKNVEMTNTQVGDTLLYTLTAKNDKDAALDTNWSDIVITDVLPAGVDFDSATADVTVTVAGTAITPDYTYDSNAHTLTVRAGSLTSQQSVVVTFKTIVNDSAVGTIITNQAKAVGESPRETPFVAGPIDPNANHETYEVTSNAATAPGDVFGTLKLASAPNTINFGTKEAKSYGQFSAKKPTYDTPLVVSDSRATLTSWTLTATVTQVMTSVEDSSYKLPEALVYKSDSKEEVLGLNQARVIMENASGGSYNVSEAEWENKDNGFEMHLSATQYRKMSEYQAVILFTLSETP